MNAVDHGHASSSPVGNASDVTKQANFYIWSFFIVFGILLYVMISAVDLYFRYETEREGFLKVGSMTSSELMSQRAEEAAILSGQRTPDVGKKNISIDAAIDKILLVTR